MRRNNRRTILTLGASSVATLGAGGVVYRSGRFSDTVRRQPDLTDRHLIKIGSQAIGTDRRRVLVIGNSATIASGFFKQLRAEAGEDVYMARASATGARLVQSLRLSNLRALVRDVPWDAVVLQDFSSTPLHAADRLASRFAIKHFARLAAPAPIVLFPHWPSEAGHRVYRAALGTGYAVPDDPDDYANRAEAHYLRCAKSSGGVLAPILPAWITALNRGVSLYQKDRHHASAAGAALAAATLWPTIQDVLA